MATDRPIFVIGCPRSGTTLLTLMLHAHSRIAMPPETKFLLDVYRRRKEFGDLTVRRNRRRLAIAIMRTRGNKFRHLGLTRRAVRRQIVLGYPTVGTAVGTVFRAYAARFGKQRWGDKLPTYFRNVEAIRELFPDAQFVHLVRDGRDCVASLKTMSWWRRDSDVIDAMAMWVHSVDCARAAADLLPRGSFHELRYEDLVADPRQQLEALCTFLDEEFEESMLEPHLVAESSLPTRQREGWHANTTKAVSANRIGTYAEVLDSDELALMEHVAGDRLRSLGYPLPESPSRPPRLGLIRYRRKIASLRTRTRVLAVRDRRVARPSGSMADRGPKPRPQRARKAASTRTSVAAARTDAPPG